LRCWLLLLQGRFDLDANKILGIVQAPGATFVTHIEPILADDRNQHVALRHLIVWHAPELGAVDVNKQLLERESLLQAPEKRLHEPGIVAAAIVDEYPVRYRG
jgi:hypothetical protein